MTILEIVLTTPAADGSQTPAQGVVRFTPTKRRVLNGTTVLPKPFQVPLVLGAAHVELAPNDASWVWRIDEHVSGTPARTIYANIADAVSVLYSDLVAIDPATLAPTAEPVAAWWALSATFATVLAASNGTDDTAMIQAALTVARTNGRGRVQGKRGENYIVPGELIIGSDTVLDLSGSAITKPDGNDTRMIRNYADTVNAGAGTATTTVGSNTITTGLAATAVIGQSIIVIGAGGNGGGPLVGQVASIDTAAGTLTVNTLDGRPENATAAVTDAVATLHNRDRNITIKLGVYDMGSNVPAGVTFGNLYARHIDGLHIEIGRYFSTVTGRAVGVGDCTNLTVRMDDCKTLGVGVQVSGPANGVHIEYVAGSAGDDLVAFTAGDYPDQQATAGDITNVTVGNVFAKDTHLNVFKLLAGAGRTIDKVKVLGGITGTGRDAGVFIGDDPYMAQTTGGTYGDIDLGTVDLQTTSYPVALLSPAISVLRARIIYDPSSPYHVGTPVAVGGFGTATIKKMILSGTITGRVEGVVTIGNAGMTIDQIIFDSMLIAPNSLSSVHNALTLTGAAAVGEVLFRDCTATFVGQSQYLVYADKGTIGRVRFRGGAYTNGNCLAFLQVAGATTVWLTNTVLDGAGRIANALSPVTLILENPVINTTGAPIYLQDAALTITGACLSPLDVQRNANESVRVNGATLTADITTLTPADGDMVFNTNGSAAGGGTAVFSAAAGKWKGLYSGTTYP